MKKTLAFILALTCMMTLLVGCGSKTESNDPQKSTSEATVDYPTDTVQIIVPYGAGGGSDTLARALISSIDFPTSMVAINVEGADGLVGAMQAYNSKADGYTILTHNTTDLLSFTLSGTTDVELYKDLVHICDLVSDYNVIATNKQSGWTTIDEMVEYAKANPGAIKWSCTGSQNIDYATTMLIIEALGITDYVTIVPYDGGSESCVALMGDHVQMTTNTSGDLTGSIASGDVVPLLVVNDTRINALPDVESTVEHGIDITFGMPRGFYAPAGTPQEVVDVLANAMKAVSEDPEFIEKMNGLGLEVSYKTGAEAAARAESWAEAFKPVFESMYK